MATFVRLAKKELEEEVKKLKVSTIKRYLKEISDYEKKTKTLKQHIEGIEDGTIEIDSFNSASLTLNDGTNTIA